MGYLTELWRTSPAALTCARIEAARIKDTGDTISPHSNMLYAYYSLYPSPGKLKKCWYAVLACWHAVNLLAYSDTLDYWQLDVLISYLLRIEMFHFFTLPTIKKLVRKELCLLEDSMLEVLPHQKALAFITSARVICAGNVSIMSKHKIMKIISSALLFEVDILAEEEKTHALYQLTQVWKGAGELYMKMGHADLAQNCLMRALGLAESKGIQDQFREISPMINQLERLRGVQ